MIQMARGRASLFLSIRLFSAEPLDLKNEITALMKMPIPVPIISPIPRSFLKLTAMSAPKSTVAIGWIT